MTTFADAVGRVFQIGFDASIKSGIILALATLVTTFARGSSAATRHRVWSLALVSCLTMPLVCLFLPQIQIPILPTGQASFTSRLRSRSDSLPTRTNHAENSPLQFQPVQALSESSRPLLSPKIPEAVPNNSPVAWPDREMTATTFPLLPLILLGGWSFCVLTIWSALIVAIFVLDEKYKVIWKSPDTSKSQIGKFRMNRFESTTDIWRFGQLQDCQFCTF